MKNFVIGIIDNPKSVAAAERCMWSGERYGSKINMFKAITPKDDPVKIAEKEGINVKGFEEVYSRFENCLSAFLSHFTLWKQCLESKEVYTIFEHDAILEDAIPNKPFTGVMNIGKPSYGKWNTPSHLGVGPLITKRYFPGAHAYQVEPRGASALINIARDNRAKPTDVFLHLDTFPWLQEHYPFIAKADDSFTTIQVERGCLAKHNYNEDYKIETIK